MPGKLCQGGKRNNIGAGRLSGSKAYCEGMSYRASGSAAAKPKTDNPHEQNSEDAIAWNNGWDLATANVGGGSMGPSLENMHTVISLYIHRETR
jgi:hypothetical protein